MVPQMKRLRKEGIGRIGVWEEDVSFHNPYPEFETELNHTPQSVFSQRESVRDRPTHTSRPSSDSNPKNGTKERFDRL